MTDHFYWIWIIFLMFPLIRIIQRYLRKRNMQNYPQSSEKQIEMQLQTNSSETIDVPRRNLTKPETKDMLVLGELNRGAKNFETMQKAQKAENDLKRIEVEARQRAAQAEGLAAANIAEATGEAEAIRIINQALAQNPAYLEWLKTQAWDGKLPLVVGEGGTPFIQIPTEP